jgi:ankyrin repeat protein
MDNATQRLYEMCQNNDFNIDEATSLMSEIDLNMPFCEPRYNSETFLLYTAVFCRNIRMAELLLQNGADPNLIVDRECALWDLQYCVYADEEYERNPEIALAADNLNLKIAQLLLEHGADTNIAPEGEDLFSYVVHAVFNDFDTGRLLEYRSRFLILLIAYSGRSEYCEPEILIPFDKNNMEQYDFSFVKCPDNYHLFGEILDANCNVVARV